jgi:endonuclease/exonuclease/phosphatase family metal-dependent hydrolase
MNSSQRRWRRPLYAAIVMVTSAVLPFGSAAADERGTTLRVLQFNLCDSGIAACYTGRSVAQAATVIRDSAPGVVTLNEVCREDVEALGRAVQDRHGGRLAWVFKAAGDRRTGDEFRCRNGQPYGIGVLARLPAASPGYTSYSGIYPMQDLRDPEERAYLCVRIAGAFDACTTHLSSTSASVALAQCHFLFSNALPTIHSRDRYAPTVVAGDFNLGEGDSAEVRACVPSGYLLRDDGSGQQVLATSEFAARSTTLIDMRATTDHPGLLVDLSFNR